MRPFESILLVINLLGFFTLMVQPPKAWSWMGHSAPIALLIAFAQGLVEGARWQLIPGYILTGILFLIWLIKYIVAKRVNVKQKQTSRIVFGLLTTFGVFWLILSFTLPIIMPVFRFSHTTGQYKIGTMTYNWIDDKRDEVFTSDSRDHREIMVQIWYPAKEDELNQHAPYIQDAVVTKTIARLLRLPDFALNHFRYIKTNAVSDAPVSDVESNYPVLIFSPGLTGYRQMNTFQVEEIVSHGYIVIAMDQPYVAAEVVFPDGRQVTGWQKGQINDLIQQSVNPFEKAPILNDRSFEEGIIPYLAKDVIFTLDQLAVLNKADPNGILTGRLDLKSIGAFGVSLGGIVTGEASLLEPRIKAFLIMDAPMTANVVKKSLQQPAMWITRDADTMRLERGVSGGWSEEDIKQHHNTMRSVFKSLSSDGYIVQITGMFHVNLMDISYWSPITSMLGITGPIDGQRAYKIINSYSLAFFDKHLKEQSAEQLDKQPQLYPEVIFEKNTP